MKKNRRIFFALRNTCLITIIIFGLVSIIGTGGGSGGSDKKSGTYTNSLGMSFKLIPAGTFTMGNLSGGWSFLGDETRHQVTLTNNFYMQATEVTQSQWQAVMDNNPADSINCGKNCPVEQVSWNDAMDFIAALNELGEGTYRLPTEAEWEYACRAGSTSAFANGPMAESYEDCDTVEDCLKLYDPNLNAIGWYAYNSGDTTHPVARKKANAWGLYDMHGNVWEWCSDWYGDYPTGSVVDPTGPSSGTYRILRGGCYLCGIDHARSSTRFYDNPDNDDISYGFRLVYTPDYDTFYRDNDGDGYGDPNVFTNSTHQPKGYVVNNNDCDDSDAGIHPGAVEYCSDGIDNNCNDSVDEGCISCNYCYIESYGDFIFSICDCEKSASFTAGKKIGIKMTILVNGMEGANGVYFAEQWSGDVTLNNQESNRSRDTYFCSVTYKAMAAGDYYEVTAPSADCPNTEKVVSIEADSLLLYTVDVEYDLCLWDISIPGIIVTPEANECASIEIKIDLTDGTSNYEDTLCSTRLYYNRACCD